MIAFFNPRPMCEASQAMLAGLVSHAGDIGPLDGPCGQINDQPVTALPHRRQYRLCAVKRAREICGQQLIPALDCQLGQAALRQVGPGGVNQQINFLPGVQSHGNQLINLVPRSDVGGAHPNGFRMLRDKVLQVLGPTCRNHHPGSRRNQRAGDGLTHAAGGPDHDRDLIPEILRHWTLLDGELRSAARSVCQYVLLS